jgi:signal transduction histidine kinase
MSKPQPEPLSQENAKLRSRLADPRLISWPTFAISSVLLSYEILLHGITDFIAAQVSVFALLALARLAYLRRPYPSHHAWVMASTIVFASLVGVIFAQLLLAEGNTVVTADGAFARMLVIPAAGLLSISLIDYRNNVRDLRSTALQLQATRDAGLESLSAAREEIVQRVRVSLEGAVADLRRDDRSQVAGELASLAQETVRPLSHELAHNTPDFTPASVPTPRVRWSVVLSDVAAKPLIVPWLMAFAVALMSIRFTFAESDEGQSTAESQLGAVTISLNLESFASSFAFLGLIFVSMWVLSAVAVRVTRPILPRVSGGKRWLTIAASVIAIGIGLQMILILVPVLPGPLSSIQTDPVGRFWAFAPVVVIALVFAIARTVSFARTSLTDELQAVNDELAWEVARIRLDLWAQQRRFAQSIHGPLQAAITASALLLTESSAATRTDAIDAAHNRIKSALDRLIDHHDSIISWETGVLEIERTWEGVCEVTVNVDSEAAGVLENDDTCRQATVMVIGESIANAAIHGTATRTHVHVNVDRSRFIRLTIQDNGTGIDTAANSGLGSAILDDACGEWEVTNTEDGARLSALVAFAAASSPGD